MKPILAITRPHRAMSAMGLALWLAALSTTTLLFADDAREVKLEDLVLKIPATWKQQKPSNNLRLGQFEIPAVEGDKEPAELTVFNFGIGGGVKANIDRWIEQFDKAERTAKTTKGKCPQGEYVMANVSGTFKKSIGPPIQGKTEPAAGYRMLGVIIAVEKKGNYFMKLTGPDKTVASAAAALRATFAGNEKEEKPWESDKAE